MMHFKELYSSEALVFLSVFLLSARDGFSCTYWIECNEYQVCDSIQGECWDCEDFCNDYGSFYCKLNCEKWYKDNMNVPTTEGHILSTIKTGNDKPKRLSTKIPDTILNTNGKVLSYRSKKTILPYLMVLAITLVIPFMLGLLWCVVKTGQTRTCIVPHSPSNIQEHLTDRSDENNNTEEIRPMTTGSNSQDISGNSVESTNNGISNETHFQDKNNQPEAWDLPEVVVHRYDSDNNDESIERDVTDDLHHPESGDDGVFFYSLS